MQNLWGLGKAADLMVSRWPLATGDTAVGYGLVVEDDLIRQWESDGVEWCLEDRSRGGGLQAVVPGCRVTEGTTEMGRRGAVARWRSRREGGGTEPRWREETSRVGLPVVSPECGGAGGGSPDRRWSVTTDEEGTAEGGGHRGTASVRAHGSGVGLPRGEGRCRRGRRCVGWPGMSPAVKEIGEDGRWGGAVGDGGAGSGVGRCFSGLTASEVAGVGGEGRQGSPGWS